ncbi:MAG TPA: class I SAM-dependent methyltransferase [Bryobacteraceae bacterium]|nr:class I SAM-dependent methyltransferase [Bryobacteraceae bacterium]HOL70324.1 class I SAM-dependent methyltransferase [Bryobacteraceae bacterium]HOQ45579.1 class I SAM-dependent methyltransferase [Bryobacteraceae bacterium]HPU73383.1 class I SAM-dependent methyltransferase [Bryobacteraceae bacterium]
MRLLMSAGFMSAAALLSIAFAQNSSRKSEEFRKEFLEKFRRTSLNTTPGDAMMLRILAESSGAKRGIEVGAASGFGAINLGIAFERTGGHLYSMEIDPRRAREARENLAKVGLEKTVTVLEGDALELLPAFDGEVDFLFIDANKSDYLRYLKAIEPKLKKGAVVVADNTIVHAQAMADYLEYVQTSPNYDTVTIRASMEKNDGMTVSYKIR